jgi:hypothetical protein
MITREVVALPDGRFGVQSLDGGGLEEDVGPFDTRVEAEEWIFNQSEQTLSGGDSHTLTPGTGQGPR